MTPFEFIFALFGLLLGLSLTEVMGGFGRTLKARQQVRMGWLTPLLGLLTAIELTAAWGSAWTARAAIPFSIVTLLVALVITGVYYLASTQVFPDATADWPDLDAYYEKHKRWVYAGLIAGSYLVMAAQGVLGIDPVPGLAMKVVVVAWTLLAAAAMLLKGRGTNLALLVTLIALDLGANVLNAFMDPYRDNR